MVVGCGFSEGKVGVLRWVFRMSGKQLLLPRRKLLFCSILSFYCVHGNNYKTMGIIPSVDVHGKLKELTGVKEKTDMLLPVISPNKAPQPFIPFLALSPLAPFTNNSKPKLSGFDLNGLTFYEKHAINEYSIDLLLTSMAQFSFPIAGRCTFNFSSADAMIRTTAIDCSKFFAPFLANVICCPQLLAILTILSGQSSKNTGHLSLDMKNANHCLSDIQAILSGQGANDNLEEICSVNPFSLTEASCPINSVNDFESMIDTSRLLTACKKVDAVNECCSQICQNEILDAATTIAFKAEDVSNVGRTGLSVEHPSIVDDCKLIVLRWLASKLEPLSANQALRRISNCNLNKACPLAFPSTSNVTSHCKRKIEDQTACCNALESYVSHLQKQCFITNLQALHCAASLSAQLRKENVTKNIYDVCHVTLKDFSLQVGSQESGCLLPSLPSDAIFDQTSGIGFTCDLNDNIAAPWLSAPEGAISTCSKTIKLPALPAYTSNNSDELHKIMMLYLLYALAIAILVQL